MKFRRLLPLAGAVLFAAPLTGGAAAPETPPALTAQYRATIAGVQVGSLAASLTAADGNYRMEGLLRTQGPVAMVLPWNYDFVSQGHLGENGPAPSSFWSSGTYKGKPRHIQVSFTADGAHIDNAQPDPAEKPKRLVPPDLRRGTLDPLSALFAIGRKVGRDGRCAQRIAVFDGRQRYDLHVLDAEANAPKPGSTAAAVGAIRCRFFYEPVAGFKDDHVPYAAARDNPGTAWFQRFQPGWPALPARAEAETSFGRFVLELVSATPGADLAARRR